MLCVSFSICIFIINNNFSQFKHLSFNMTSYYDSFVTWNRKTSTLDIFARHPKTDVALLCVGPKLWKFSIFINNSKYFYLVKDQNRMYSHFIIIISEEIYYSLESYRSKWIRNFRKYSLFVQHSVFFYMTSKRKYDVALSCKISLLFFL